MHAENAANEQKKSALSAFIRGKKSFFHSFNLIWQSRTNYLEIKPRIIKLNLQFQIQESNQNGDYLAVIITFRVTNFNVGIWA